MEDVSTRINENSQKINRKLSKYPPTYQHKSKKPQKINKNNTKLNRKLIQNQRNDPENEIKQPKT